MPASHQSTLHVHWMQMEACLWSTHGASWSTAGENVGSALLLKEVITAPCDHSRSPTSDSLRHGLVHPGPEAEGKYIDGPFQWHYSCAHVALSISARPFKKLNQVGSKHFEPLDISSKKLLPIGAPVAHTYYFVFILPLRVWPGPKSNMIHTLSSWSQKIQASCVSPYNYLKFYRETKHGDVLDNSSTHSLGFGLQQFNRFPLMFPKKFCYVQPNLELIICWFQRLIWTITAKLHTWKAQLRKTVKSTAFYT